MRYIPSIVFVISLIAISILFLYLNTSEIVQYWAQLLAGNWSGLPKPIPEKLGEIHFVISAIVAISLNIGNFIAVVAFIQLSRRALAKFTRLESSVEHIMKLNQALLLRDWSIRNSILANTLPGDREKMELILQKSFSEGANTFSEKHLETFFGREKAEEIREFFMKEELGPTRPSP